MRICVVLLLIVFIIALFNFLLLLITVVAVDPKPPRTELALQSHAYIYMGVPLGRCPPHVANSLYRRVIVTPEGNVESADEHEQKFLDSAGVASGLITSSHSSESRNRTLGTGVSDYL